MIKRINWKAVVYGFVWIVSIGALGLLMSFIEHEKAALRCKQVKIIIPGNQNFVESDEIGNILLEDGGPLAGRMLSRINIHRLENLLKANPFVEFAKVYADMDGTISVNIKQREPLLRVINMAGKDFYVDKNGLKIPTSENFTARVLVANGFIAEGFSGKTDTLRTALATDLFKTAQFIQNDSLWASQIEQLYVNDDGIIELIPRVGKQRIVLGNADSLQKKFGNLLAFYKEAIPRLGWDTYKTINISYANQVVCQKNETDSSKRIAAAKAKPYSQEKENMPDTALLPDTIQLIEDTLTTATAQ